MLEGWLTKQGGFIRNWKRRWFRVDGRHLKYFEQRADRVPRGMILIPGAWMQEHQDGDNDVSLPFVIDFHPANTSRVYFLKADSDADRKRWMDFFENVLRVRRVVPAPANPFGSLAGLVGIAQSIAASMSGGTAQVYVNGVPVGGEEDDDDSDDDDEGAPPRPRPMHHNHHHHHPPIHRPPYNPFTDPMSSLNPNNINNPNNPNGIVQQNHRMHQQHMMHQQNHMRHQQHMNNMRHQQHMNHMSHMRHTQMHHHRPHGM